MHLTVLCCFLFLVFMVVNIGALCLIFANNFELFQSPSLWLATERVEPYLVGYIQPSLVVEMQLMRELQVCFFCLFYFLFLFLFIYFFMAI